MAPALALRHPALLAVPPIVLVIAYVAVPGLSTAGGDVLNAYNLSFAVSLAVLVAAVALRRPQPLWPWALIIVADALWFIGDVVYTLIGYPSVSIADAFYLPAYVALIVAVIAFIRMRTRQRDVDSLIDTALIAAAALLAVAVLIIEPAWDSPGTSALGQVLNGVYPIFDVLLVVMLVRLLLTPGRRPVAAVLLIFGLACIFAADTIYAVIEQTGGYGTDTLSRSLDATWLAGYALFALAALHPSMVDLTIPAADAAPSRLGGLFVAALSLASIPAIAIAASALGYDPGVWWLAVATCTIVPLVVWRNARLERAVSAAREQLRMQERYYRAVAMSSSDAFLVVDRNASVMDASAALKTLIGYSPEAAIGADALDFVIDDDRDLARALLESSLAKPGMTVSDETRIRTAGGTWRWVELRCSNLLDDPAVAGIVVNSQDITARKRAEAELEFRALHDSLTGLANRALLKDRIDHALARRSRSGSDIAIVYVDLDGFKYINDTLGHDAGDELLRVTAMRLSELVRVGDTVARLGGDEFAVLLEGGADLDNEATVVAERLLEALAEPVVLAGTSVVVTGSLGLALPDPDSAPNAEELLRDADTAMYGAKSAGRNRLVRYVPGMRAAAIERLELGAGLQGAVGRGEMLVQYQPVVELTTGVLTGFEALVRWQHPTRGLLQPEMFIPLAENTGVIREIGAHVLRTACRAAAAWQRAGSDDEPVTIAVNLSAREVASESVVEDVSAALQATGLPPRALVLELTESALVERPDEVAPRLRALKELGVRLAIDDFGVGYSSLSYLRQFPVDILKLDRSFVETIASRDQVPAIVHGMLELARTLDLQTVAEGIETDAQLRSLAGDGCELGQGFLFDGAVDEAAADDLVQRGRYAGAAVVGTSAETALAYPR